MAVATPEGEKKPKEDEVGVSPLQKLQGEAVHVFKRGQASQKLTRLLAATILFFAAVIWGLLSLQLWRASEHESLQISKLGPSHSEPRKQKGTLKWSYVLRFLYSCQKTSSCVPKWLEEVLS